MEDVKGVGEAVKAFLPDGHGAASIEPIDDANILFRLVGYNSFRGLRLYFKAKHERPAFGLGKLETD